MNATRLVTIAFAMALLSGCGNKGPLVLPTPPAENAVPAPESAPAEATPVEAAPTEPAPPAEPTTDSQTPPAEEPVPPPAPGGHG
ncbi:LPS translocon maturation chaperone LptM [Lysobacter terrae]